MGVFIGSEIGDLQEVVVHTPGREIEVMTPDTASEVLYNEIIPLSLVSEQHSTLKDLLSTFALTHELTELFEEAIRNDDVRKAFISDVTERAGIKDRAGELQDLSSQELVSTMVTGLKQRKNTVSEFLSGAEFDLPPLPNLYFMRDGAAVFRDGVIISAMAHAVRAPEALMVSYVFGNHPTMGDCDVHFDGSMLSSPDLTIEGGDIIVARSNLLLIGVSERTTANAVDKIAVNLSAAYQEPISVIAVVLPKKRATIHLDMIFTFLDYAAALVYAPYVTGDGHLPVMRLDADPTGRTKITEFGSVLSALRDAGIHVEPVLCGGRDPLLQQREQWLSAANVFAIAPGKVVGYDCNSATAEELSNAGFEIAHAKDFLSGKKSIEQYDRLFIGIPGVELARGGGGVRCMTLPLKRMPVT